MSSSSCGSCDGRCCRDMVVPVTGADIVRICQHTGLATQDVVDFTDILELQSTHHDVVLEGQYKYLVLKRVNGACVFFDSEKGGVNCKIHDVKPLLCRLYPYVSLPGLGVKARIRHMCGYVEEVSGEQSEDIDGIAEQYYQERDEFNSFVQRWNQSGKNTKQDLFFSSLMDSLSNR